MWNSCTFEMACSGFMLKTRKVHSRIRSDLENENCYQSEFGFFLFLFRSTMLLGVTRVEKPMRIFGMFQSTNQVKCKMSFPCFRFDVILPFSDNLFIRVSEENRIPNFLENWFLIKSTDTHSIRILLWLEEESHFNLSAVSSARNTFRPLCVYIKVKLLVKYALALFDTLRKCK